MLKHYFLILFLIIMISSFSSIPNLHLVRESFIPPLFRHYISIHTYRIGDTGFFSYTLSIDPDFILYKIGHITLFGALGVAIYFASRQRVWAAILGTFLFATADEIHQYFVPGRSCRLGDILLDILSAAIFVFIVHRKQAKSLS